jgi:anhydro-N-acetylmuramic acid kinase
MQALQRILRKKQRRILGLMSGTSCDGLDMALINVEGHSLQTNFQLLAVQTVPYPTKQKKALLDFIKSPQVSLQSISQMNFYLAQIWAEMIEQFFQDQNLQATSIDLIASHGQTLWHQPQGQTFIDRPVTSTLQMGDPAVLAQLTGITVIGDFRVADVALGGQGAPLIPFFDWIYFSRFHSDLLILNIGGISNVTFIPADGAFERIMAFDCGPGNMLIDQAMQHFYQKGYDRDGAIARSGRLSQDLLNALLAMDHFIEQAPPKSTGREHYDNTFFHQFIQHAEQGHIPKQDIIHTLTEYTALAIHRNYRGFIEPFHPVKQLIASGGGADNRFLMERLQHYFQPVKVSRVRDFQLDGAYKEAIGFAVLANETLHGLPSNVPAATRARRPAILGKICSI